MEWFIAAAAVAALGVAAMAAAGGMGEMSDEPVYDTFRHDLPDTPLSAADLEQVRFGVAIRGYAMVQVDDLLERLGREIAERDARIAALTGEVEPPVAVHPSPSATEDPPGPTPRPWVDPERAVPAAAPEPLGSVTAGDGGAHRIGEP